MNREESTDRGIEERGGGRHRGKGHSPRGAKTFRRGRALAFLEGMQLKRSTLHQQLDKPEFEPIQQVLLGELEANDMVIAEFTQLFEIHEDEMDNKEQDVEATGSIDKKGAAENEEN